MQFEHTPEARNLAAVLRELLAPYESVRLARAQLDNPADVQHSRALWQALVQQGWTAFLLPEHLGGAGVSLVDAAPALAETGRALLPLPYIETAVAAATVLEHAQRADARTDEAVASLLGGAMWSVAWPERLISAAGQWVPEGRSLVPFGHAVDAVLVARPEPDGMALLLVPAHDLDMTLPRGSDGTFPLAEMRSPLIADAGTVLLRGAAGQQAYQAMMARCIAAWCLWAAGGMRRVVEMTAAYATTRMQFGVPIGSFQAVKHHCANMEMETLQAEVLSDAAAWSVTADAPARNSHLALARAAAATREAYYAVASLGLQVHGGIGFTWDADPHLYFRAAARYRTFLGSAAAFQPISLQALGQDPTNAFSRWL